MDYTTVTRVKQALKIDGSGGDALLATLVTAASRAIDRHCTGIGDPSSDDYFLQETVTDELLRAPVGADGRLSISPHKPTIDSVSAISYRFRPDEDWESVDVTLEIVIDNARVLAFVDELQRGKAFVKISYTGGFATDAASLPADLVEAATTLTARYYREDESGLTDAIGVAEIGELRYTEALPIGVRRKLQPFVRVVPW